MIKTLIIRALCLGFFVLISMPMLINIMTPNQSESSLEKRTLAPLPDWPSALPDKEYFTGLNDYTNDHFGLRQNFIDWHQSLMWNLGESPSRSVIRGEENWLFLKIFDPLLRQQQHGTDLVRKRLVHRARTSGRLNRWLKEKGIAYRYIVAANKMTVYPEYLPKKFRLTDINASLEFFKSEVPDDTRSVHIYSDELFAKHPNRNSDYELYLKNDTHWSQVGANIVAEDLFASLSETNPEIEIADMPQQQFYLTTIYSGDLAKYIGLDKALSSVEAKTDLLVCAQPKSAQRVRWNVSLSRCESSATRVFLIGDSFSANLIPFISQRVGEIYVVRQPFSRFRLRQLIETYEPDLVIEQIVERELASAMPH